MLYLSTARIPSEKAHAYQIVKMCEAFARQEADVTLLYQKRDNSAWTQDIHDVFAYYGVRVPFAMKQHSSVLSSRSWGKGWHGCNFTRV